MATYPFELVEVDKDILEYLTGLVGMQEQYLAWVLHLSEGGVVVGWVVVATAADHQQ